MNKQIWKFEIEWSKKSILIPEGAEILTVQIQNEIPCIWVLVKPENTKIVRHFELYGTGQDIYCDMGIERKYINTIQFEGGSVDFHLFERIS